MSDHPDLIPMNILFLCVCALAKIIPPYVISSWIVPEQIALCWKWKERDELLANKNLSHLTDLQIKKKEELPILLSMSLSPTKSLPEMSWFWVQQHKW